MKIGILTFHWGTNYGAILQAWCLQEYLIELGHDVEIIDYKPSNFDFSWLYIAKHPSLWKSIRRQLYNRKKENLLKQFRKQYLRTTHRFFSVNEFGNELNKYDVLISGSDQVLNWGFSLHGENGNPSPAYWLNIGQKDTRRLGYAVSFGCENYPETAATVVRNWVNGFDAIGVRERTGQQILDSLRYNGPKDIVPDPTLLIGSQLFERLRLSLTEKQDDYICVYMLRHEIQIEGNVVYIDEKHNPLTMEEWLITIARAQGIVTNSYHGTIIAILAHVPFAILLENGVGQGMNDRFFTLLDRLCVNNRVAYTKDKAVNILQEQIDFNELDLLIKDYGDAGKLFLNNNLQQSLS